MARPSLRAAGPALVPHLQAALEKEKHAQRRASLEALLKDLAQISTVGVRVVPEIVARTMRGLINSPPLAIALIAAAIWSGVTAIV